MTRTGKRPPPAPAPEPELLPVDDSLEEADDDGEADEALIVMRPDGYYWVSVDGRQSFGPFDTLEEARADRDMAGEESPEPGETLQEAESELGIAEWIDPETGDPAEGQSRPHLDFE
jgi:hypothetical protein